MAYEHQVQVNAAAAAVMDAMDLLMDDVPDKDQALQLMLDATTAFQAIAAAMTTEQKKEFKAKFLAKLGLKITDRSLDKFLPDSAS